MEWNEDNEDGVTIVHLKGEIDLHQTPKLREYLQEKIKSNTPALLLDFEKVSYIDSSGIATLIEYYQSALKYSGKMGISATSERVHSVFQLVRLNEIFSFFSTTREGIQTLSGS